MTPNFRDRDVVACFSGAVKGVSTGEVVLPGYVQVGVITPHNPSLLPNQTWKQILKTVNVDIPVSEHLFARGSAPWGFSVTEGHGRESIGRHRMHCRGTSHCESRLGRVSSVPDFLDEAYHCKIKTDLKISFSGNIFP